MQVTKLNDNYLVYKNLNLDDEEVKNLKTTSLVNKTFSYSISLRVPENIEKFTLTKNLMHNELFNEMESGTNRIFEIYFKGKLKTKISGENLKISCNHLFVKEIIT